MSCRQARRLPPTEYTPTPHQEPQSDKEGGRLPWYPLSILTALLTLPMRGAWLLSARYPRSTPVKALLWSVRVVQFPLPILHAIFYARSYGESLMAILQERDTNQSFIR